MKKHQSPFSFFLKISAALLVAVINLSATAKEPVKVACIGNSITYGFLVEDREHNAYPAVLGRLLGPGYEVANFGHSGTTLLRKGHRPFVGQEEYVQSLAYKPDIVLFHLGVNDTDPRNWPHHGDEFVTDYLDLIADYRRANPDVRVIVSRLTPLFPAHFRFATGTKAWRDSINSAIERVAELAGAELMDFGRVLIDRPDLLPEAIHPNAAGAALMAREAAAVITGRKAPTRLLPVYAPSMVLQRYRPIRIAGTSGAGNAITVALDGDTAAVIADKYGQWAATLPPRAESTGLTLTVAAPDTLITLPDVAVGEVWIASGQSNMEFRVKSDVTADEAKAAPADPLLRFFTMRPTPPTDNRQWTEAEMARVDSLDYFVNPPVWEAAGPATVPDMSAVAYYFGRALRDSLRVPVGIVANAVGGSTTESWIDIETLMGREPAALVKWQTNDYLQPWAQGRAKLNAPGHRHPYEPSYLFAAGVRPLGSLPVAGTIWYQGESNAHNIEVHERLFANLVESWRKHFNSPDMPFLTVQLSSLNRPSWPLFRDSQRRLAAAIPGVGMAVSSDVGDSLDVHPRFKKPVGERLARLALHDVYSSAATVPSGPLPLRAVGLPGGRLAIEMEWADGMHASAGDSLIGFEVASSIHGPYHPAAAQIDGTRIILSSPHEQKPAAARYGWQPFTRANLVNAAGLPASTFRIAAEEPGCPDSGIERGVSASFSALLPSGLIMTAGGCNFPSDTPLAPAARKKYYQGIYTADPSAANLSPHLAAMLPRPMAYGATASTRRGAVMIGGSNDSGLSDKVWLFDGESQTELPSLPWGVDNAAAAADGNRVYLAGGTGPDGMPGRELLMLDLDKAEKGWQKLKPMPGNARMQPAAAITGGKLYVFGGFAGRTPSAAPTVSTDALCYDIRRDKWSKIKGPEAPDGTPLTLAGGAAGTLADGRIIAAGGVNADIFLAAITDQAPDYLSHPVEWYRFNPYVCIFNPDKGTWTLADSPATARAGASLVVTGNEAIVLGGEIKPRIRTPRPVRLKP